MQFPNRFRVGVIGGFLVACVALIAPRTGIAGGHVFSTGPSAFCHVTDGQFTDCDPGGGVEEWSDIRFLAGLGTSIGSIVYTDQSLNPPKLYLMYDLTGHTAPLAVDSFFDITFHVVEDGQLEVYTVQCFGDGTFRVFEDGEDITDEADTVDCAVGFNGNNVQVELEIDTLVTYSPDIPLFWSTHAPPPGNRPPCPPEDPNCEPCPPEDPGCVPPPCPPDDPRCEPPPCPPEDPGCEPRAPLPPDAVQTSSTMVIASSNGVTHVVGLPLGQPAPGQLCDRRTGTGLLVDLFELFRGGKHGAFVSRVARYSKAALASLAGFGLISESEIGALHGCIVSTVAKKK